MVWTLLTSNLWGNTQEPIMQVAHITFYHVVEENTLVVVRATAMTKRCNLRLAGASALAMSENNYEISQEDMGKLIARLDDSKGAKLKMDENPSDAAFFLWLKGLTAPGNNIVAWG